MGVFKIDFNQFRPSSNTKQVTPSVKPVIKQPSPTPEVKNLKLSSDMQVPALSAPINTNKIKQVDTAPSKGIVGKIFDALAIPSQVTEKFLTGGKGYEQKLKEDPKARKLVSNIVTAPITNNPVGNFLFGDKLKNKVEDTLKTNETSRNIAGGAGRIAIDPLNFIPMGAVTKVAKVIPGVTKGIEIVKGAGNLVEKIPGVAKTIETVGKNFVKGYKLPEEYNIMKSEIPTKVGQGATEIIERTQKQFGQPYNFIKSFFKGKQTEKF